MPFIPMERTTQEFVFRSGIHRLISSINQKKTEHSFINNVTNDFFFLYGSNN